MNEQKLQDTDPNTFDVEKDDFCIVDGVRYEVGLVGGDENSAIHRRVILSHIYSSSAIAIYDGCESSFIRKRLDVDTTFWKFHKPLPKKTYRPMNSKEMYALIREGRLFRTKQRLPTFIEYMDKSRNIWYLYNADWYSPEQLEYLDDDLNPVPCMVEVVE